MTPGCRPFELLCRSKASEMRPDEAKFLQSCAFEMSFVA